MTAIEFLERLRTTDRPVDHPGYLSLLEAALADALGRIELLERDLGALWSTGVGTIAEVRRSSGRVP